ncbi:zonadhesin isoform X1 [Gadus morhua]|uniref:zonadhesin isoform X1 n=1 Tax=Gadus morhua TaxID=8049 RepID=UPI0011B5B8C0|nr:zonadhesin-like isoform X1 [Gadus morhua]
MQGGFHTHLLATLSLLLLTQVHAKVPCGNSSLTLPSWGAQSEYLAQCVLHSDSGPLCDWTTAQRVSGGVALTFLESPALSLEGEACLEFWYQMAPTASESLELRVLLKENTQGLLQIWTTPGQQNGGAWRHVSLPLAATKASTQVVFEADQESGVSFDHIGIRNGQCGRQCEPNTDLWTDKSTRCVCSAAEQLSCSTPLCPGGQTSDRPSERSAKGVMVGRGICTIHTDPQCSTFDGALFRFMAPCTYILAKTCVPIRGLPVFSVEVVNTQDAINASEATVERINVEVNNVRLSLLKRETKRVMVNGVWRSLPLTILGATVKIRNNPAVVTVETDDRVLISYDNAGAVHLKLPSAYAGKVCGMCGNFNSLGEDDNRRPDGSAARDATDLALSWQTGAHAGPCDAVLVPHVCDPLEELSYGSRQFCGELLSTTGPFSRCLPVLGVESYYRSCVAGMCVSHGDLDAMCHTMQSYAKICYDAGVAVPAWRNGTTCTLECGANSHYEACADRCLDGCSSMDLAGTCGPCEERCVCDKGYKLSGGVCVLAENCGCWNDGRHYEKGAVFVHGGCTQRCQCLGNGQTLCSAWGCSGSQVCKDKDGVKGCFTPETVTCSMYGDPHYITYDGKAYDFQGGCNYTLATTCGEKTPVRFTVTGRNANPTDQNLTRSKLETVVLQIQELHLTLQQNRKVYVHNNQVRLPYTVDGSYGLLKVTRQRQFVVVETGVGLRVMIDGQNRLFLQVDERYKGQLCGMCGTYSDWQGDDFVRPDWSNATGAFDFGNSWRVMEDSSPCIALPDDPKVCDEQGDEQAVSDCSAILDDSFSACHKPVHPLKYVSSCVYDHCATSGDLHTLCDSLESYRAACQVAGVELPAWQNNTACAVIPNTTPPPTSTPLTPAPTPDQTLCALNCNFDSHVCGWQQLIQDSFDWTRQSGPTPSFSTGPNEDHTGEGYYMYIEGDGMTHGNSARLLSAQCNYRGPLCLQFWYHMHGSASAMALNIYHLHAVQAEKVWSMVNDQGSEWHQAFVDIKEKGTFQIIIEAIRGSTALSDVAIDDISIQFGSCSNGSPAMLSGSSLVPQTRREPLLSRPVCSLDCSFNGNLCGWSQAMTDAFDWTMERGSTPTLMTGPSADHTGDGHYLYIEANSATYGDTARLLSSECSLAGPQCLRFWYHMYGSADTMGLHVYLLQDRLAEAVWWKRNDQGDVWKEAMVELTATGTFQIIFEGRRGSNDQSDVAIDDVKLYHGLCSDLTAALPSSPQPNTSITTQGDSAPSTAAPLPPTGDVTAHTTVTVLPSVTSEVPAMTTTTTTAPLQETHPVCKMNCDFEQDLCEWNQMVTDVFDWTRHNGSSPTIRTGPSSDHMAGGGHYLYIEANSATYGDTARLLSSECSHTGPQCLRFWYHMYGSADTMGLHVYLLQDRLANSVWGKRNDQGDVWKEAMVDLTTDGPFRIIFEGRRGSNDQSDAAIDDVSLRPGHCADIVTPTTSLPATTSTSGPEISTTAEELTPSEQPQPQTTLRPQPNPNPTLPPPETTVPPKPPTTEGPQPPTTEGVPNPTTARPQPQTTEGVPHPTTARPQPPTTEGVPHPTTARPQPQTTEGEPHPTTARPQPPTTEGVPHPTTARPQPPTTEGVPHPTTARPQPPTTEGVPHPTTARPQPETTEGVPHPTTARPQPTTTEGAPHPTTARPQPPTTEGVPRPTTARPQPQTTEGVPHPTTEGVSHPTTARPQPQTTEGVPHPTTARPQPQTTEGVPRPTTARPQPQTTEGVPHPTTARPQPPTTEGVPHPTTARPQPQTTEEVPHPTTEGVPRPTTARPQPQTTGVPHPTTARPQPPTTEGVPYPTTARPLPQTTEGVPHPTTARPQPPTTEGVPRPTTARPQPQTTEGVPHPTTARPQPQTTEGVPRPTTARPRPQTTEGVPHPTTARPQPQTTEEVPHPTTEGVPRPTTARPQPQTTGVSHPTTARPQPQTTEGVPHPTTARPQPQTTEGVPRPTTARPQPQTTEGVPHPTTARPQPPTTEGVPHPTTARPQPQTTEEVPHPTTEGVPRPTTARPQPQTTGVPHPTTARPQPPTTEGVPYPTTARPLPQTTEGVPHPTTARPQPPTTEGVPRPTTARPQPQTTEGVPHPTTARPQPQTTEGVPRPTTARPRPQTTEGVPHPTTARPQPQTTEEVPHPTTEGVPRPTTARPQPQTTGVPHPTTARPQPQTTEGVPHPTTARPQPPTTEGVPHPTTARPQPPTTEGVPHPTTEGVPHPTTARPQPPTTEGVPRPTTARPQPQTTTTLPLTPTKPVRPTTERPQQSTTFKPTPSCPKNSQHTPCMSPCQPTCTRPQGPPGCRRTSPCKQGCVCDAGYVLKWNAACVPIRQCGCVDRDGSVHNFNDKWYTAHCRQKCECKKDDRVGEVDCDDEDECDGDGVCLPNTSGQYKCLSTDFKECTIKGDPEYRTFDDRKHKFRGDHSYVLAQTTSQSRTLPGFYVEGINTHDEGDGDHSEDSDERSSEEHHHSNRERDEDSDEDDEDYDDDSEENNRRHRLREMKIRVYNHTVEFKRNGVLVVDGWVSHPPISPSGGLSIRKHSSRLYLNTDFGLSVTFDGHSQAAEIILPHIYRRKVAGLCGNFDGKKKNDFMKPDGRQARDEQEFGQSWRVTGDPLRIRGR